MLKVSKQIDNARTVNLNFGHFFFGILHWILQG